MAYYDVSLLQQDQDFRNRVAACYSTELVANDVLPVGMNDPWSWAATYAWAMASAPGFADAYASAIAGSVPNPGRDPSVISDAQILSAVQHITTPPPEPEPPVLDNELPEVP